VPTSGGPVPEIRRNETSRLRPARGICTAPSRPPPLSNLDMQKTLDGKQVDWLKQIDRLEHVTHKQYREDAGKLTGVNVVMRTP
jgi:hypothetical protein